MKKVYLLIEYFNFEGEEISEVLGIFTSKKIAKLYLESYCKGPCSRVEIHEEPVNPFKAELIKGLKYYFLRMTKEGKVYDLGLAPFAPMKEINPYLKNIGFCLQNNMFYKVFARDEKDAIDKCNEQRMKILSKNEWPEPESNLLRTLHVD
jgi:hypothetical protein